MAFWVSHGLVLAFQPYVSHPQRKTRSKLQHFYVVTSLRDKVCPLCFSQSLSPSNREYQLCWRRSQVWSSCRNVVEMPLLINDRVLLHQPGGVTSFCVWAFGSKEEATPKMECTWVGVWRRCVFPTLSPNDKISPSQIDHILYIGACMQIAVFCIKASW